MWRAAYREHVEVCCDAVDWLVAQDEVAGSDDEPVRRYAESWYPLQPLVRKRRGPRLVAEAFDSTLVEVLREIARSGTAVAVYRSELTSYLLTMRAYGLFQPWTMLPIVLSSFMVFSPLRPPARAA